MANEYTFEVYKDKRKETRWRMKAPNSNIIADSAESYKNLQDLLDELDAIRDNALAARIVFKFDTTQ